MTATLHADGLRTEPAFDCSLGRPAVIEGRAQLSGGGIAYTSAGTGPVVVLIHGLGGTRRTWQHLIPTLAHAHTVIAPDLPGHGESDPPAGDYSLGAHACAIRDLLVSLGHRSATIVGHSLGGGVALQTAYQFPDRTERLMLISSGGLGSEVAPMLRAATLPGAETVVAGLSRIPTAVTRRVLAMVPPLAASPDADALSGVLRGLAGSQQRRAFVRTAQTVIDWRGQTVSADRQLGLLRDVPVLVAWGTRDTTIPPSHHQSFAERVPHAVMVEIAGAGHYPHESAPGQLLCAMDDFLAETAPFQYSEAGWADLLTASRDDGTAPCRQSSTVPDLSQLAESLASHRIVDMAVGALMGLRGCAEHEALAELTQAGRETGLGPHGIGQALVESLADDGVESPDSIVARRRWHHLLTARGKQDPRDVAIRFGATNGAVRC